VTCCDTSSLSHQGSTQANLPFKHKKEQSHKIYQIFRPTTCTLIGVASWDMSSLSPGLYSSNSAFQAYERDCLMRFLSGYIGQRLALWGVWPAGNQALSLSAVLYWSNSHFSKHKKGMSHEIVRIFRQTSFTLIGVTSWDTSSLSPQGSSAVNLLFKLTKGTFSWDCPDICTCTLRGLTSCDTSSLSAGLYCSKSAFQAYKRDCLMRFLSGYLGNDLHLVVWPAWTQSFLHLLYNINLLFSA
jgi:hypothetical protein